jgi:GrpB-like predicted nucleotidyltransferase (UPF0157 family)
MDEAELRAVTIGEPERLDGTVFLADPDPSWPAWFERESARIRSLLGERALLVEHVGSTSVPGLIAKPRLDILLAVADPADEAAYVPALEDYVLRVREPEWHQHRLLTKPQVNLHVFGPDSPEIGRMVRFRDRLRSDPAARERYAAAKRELAARTWDYMQGYADAKSAIVEAILHETRLDPPSRT